MAGELTAKEKVVGLKQTRRAVTQGTARQVYLACDADPALTEPLLAPFRKMIGKFTGGRPMVIDLSPIVVFLIIEILIVPAIRAL